MTVTDQTETLADALPKQIARVRDELIPQYESIGPAGAFAIAMMRASIRAAENAIMEGDTVAMIRAYKDLEGYTS